MSRLTVQQPSERVPIERPWCVGVLDCTIEQASAAFGWTWDEVEVAGLGPMFYVALAWDGTSRFLLSASGFYPDDGISIETSESEDAAQARSELLGELGLTPAALLAVSEKGVWFARWDPPSNAGERPATATQRPFA